jgi:hypothetical protein
MALQCDAPSSLLMLQHLLVQELQRQIAVMAAGSACGTHGSGWLIGAVAVERDIMWFRAQRHFDVGGGINRGER